MTAIDYAALVERAKLGISIANDKRISQDAVGIVSELVAAIERLTQPGGEVEPVGKFIFNELIAGWQQAPEDSDGELQYSAETVARLIAERDAAKTQSANRLIGLCKCGDERDALQEQVKTLRSITQAALSWIDAVPKDVVLPAMPGFDRDWAEEALAATEPEEKV